MSFQYHGAALRNHNHLLGRVEGVDGIKTGYTVASGFNLVASVHRGERYLVAVVLGGSSGGARDAKMRSLIEEHIVEASTRRTAPVLATVLEAAGRTPKGVSGDPEPAMPPEHPAPVNNLDPATTAANNMAQPGSAEPIEPIPVKTIAVKPGTIPRSPPPWPRCSHHLSSGAERNSAAGPRPATQGRTDTRSGSAPSCRACRANSSFGTP